MMRSLNRVASLCLLPAYLALPHFAQAQGASSKPDPAAKSAPAPSEPSGFSIESEMLTYRALESNSEAIACDIAAYLRGGAAEFDGHPKGPVCAVRGGAQDKPGSVVIVPFEDAVLDNFRLWRAQMQIVNDLRRRATAYCPTLGGGNRGATTSTTPTAPAVPGAAVFTPAGSALSLAQTMIGLFASQTSIAPVGGTIRDQAFMDGVGRELRNLNVSVLLPAVYVPGTFTAADVAKSPFLQSLDHVRVLRACIASNEGKSEPGKEKVDTIISDIDTYFAALWGAPAASKPSASAPAGGSKPSDPAASVSASSPLMAILSGDDLARKLGINSATGLPSPGSEWQHVLLVKALESGGTVEKTSTILHTKIRYSGGSVGSFALFSLDGDLECSGNVYAYGGSLPAKNFETGMRRYNSDTARQFIFQHGSCRPKATP